MTRTLLHRIAGLTVGLALAMAATAVRAPAALDMALGDRKVVDNQPISACNAAAKAALDAVLHDSNEIGSSSGEWAAFAPATTPDGTTATAAVHCFPLGNGYVVTFTCATQVPPDADTAQALCTKLSAAFR